MKTKDINRYLELAFGNTFEPLPESADGKVRLQCTSKMGDAMRKGVTFRGEEIKAHMKKKRDGDSSDEEEPSDDDEGGYKRLGAKKSVDKDAKRGKAKKWFVGCYGCGGDHWRRGVEAHAATNASRRPAACVEPDAAGAPVAVVGAAGATDADILEPVEEGAAAV